MLQTDEICFRIWSLVRRVYQWQSGDSRIDLTLYSPDGLTYDLETWPQYF